MNPFTRVSRAAAMVEDQAGFEARSLEISISSPAALALLGGGPNFSGEFVSETTALNLSAVWRAVSLITGTLSALPMPTYRMLDNGDVEVVKSFLDNPAGPDSYTPSEWKSLVFFHRTLHGEAFLLPLYGGANQLLGLHPVHPRAVNVAWGTGDDLGVKVYNVSLQGGGSEKLYAWSPENPDGIVHIMGMSSDGLRGMSPLQFGRTSLGMGLAAERSAANQFKNGMNIAGVLTPAMGEELSIADIEAIKEDLRANLVGTENANTVPLVNRILQFQAWSMTNEDAQFMESRVFQIEEIARWFGIPPFLLMQLEKSTSWGTGISEQNKNLVQYVLQPLVTNVCERLSLMLSSPRYVSFDFAQLESGSTRDMTDLLLSQVNGGLTTPNEARQALHLPPVEGGDSLRVPSGVMLVQQLEASAAVAEKTAAEPTAAPIPEEGQ